MKTAGALPVACLLGFFGVSSCGFTPAYAPGSPTRDYMSDIYVADPSNNRGSYLFVREMEKRIGRHPEADKILKHDVWIFGEGQGLASASDRQRLVGKVTYKLVSRDDGHQIAGGTVESFTSFSPSPDLNRAPERDALERLAVILADKMATQLMALSVQGEAQ